MSRQRLLIVTEDGYGKRVAIDEIRCTQGRNSKGVNVSRVPVAAALVVDNTDAEAVIATANGKVERVRVGDVPTRRRSDPSSGRISKGVSVIRLDPGDRVASVALIASPTRVEKPPAAMSSHQWPAGRVGLDPGERAAQTQVLHDQRPLDEITPGGTLAVNRDEWTQTDVHRHSTYFCAHCGRQHPSPDAVYACIDQHATQENAK